GAQPSMRLRQLRQGQPAFRSGPGSKAGPHCRSRSQGMGNPMNRLLALILAFALVPTFDADQTYPQRPVHMIVPFSPGGATDALGRLVAYFLSQRLGEQVIVENRPGGGGVVGAEVASRAAPDGYTVLLGSAESFGMTEAIRKRLTYN